MNFTQIAIKIEVLQEYFDTLSSKLNEDNFKDNQDFENHIDLMTNVSNTIHSLTIKLIKYNIGSEV